MSNVWALEVEHLVKTYRDAAGRETPVLKDVSFTVAAGEVVAVTGASGSGKSTLLHAAGGLDAFDGGRLEIVRAEGDILHYRRVGVVQTAEIILNRGPHLIAEEAFGKSTEVNPCGFTVLVEDNEPEHIGYFSVY